jgi:hypothetical protein
MRYKCTDLILICLCHDIAEILLKFALNTNQSINQLIELLVGPTKYGKGSHSYIFFLSLVFLYFV